MPMLPNPIEAFAQQFGLGGKKRAKLTPELAFGAEAAARAKEISAEMEKARMLQALGMKGAPEGQMISGRYVAPSITQQLAGLAQLYMGNKQEKAAGEEQAQIAAAQQEQEANAMREMFAPKTPGGPMQPPSFDEADAAQFAPGGGAATAMLPVAATPEDVANRAAKFQGTKVASQVQDAMLKKQVGAMFDDPKMLQVEGGVFDPKTGEFKISPQAKEKLAAEMALKRDTLEQRATEATQRAEDNRLNREQRAQAAAEALAARREIAAMGKAMGGGTLVTTGDVDPATGRPVMVNNRSGELKVAGTGAPPAGGVMSKGAFEKGQSALSTAVADERKFEAELKAAENMGNGAKAFGNTAGAASVLPPAVSSRIQSATLTPEQMTLRRQVMEDAGKKAHEIYGAALTAGEQKKAASFILQPTSDWPTVQQYLRDRAALGKSVRARVERNLKAGRAIDYEGDGEAAAPKAAPAAKGGGGWGKAEKQG